MKPDGWTWAAVVSVALLSGCVSNQKLSDAAREHLTQVKSACLPEVSFPTDVTSRDFAHRDERMSVAGEMEALRNAGLVKMTPLVARAGDLMQPVRRYELSEAGGNYFRVIGRDSVTGQTDGQFCYGRFALDKVTRSDQPVKIGGRKMAAFYYTYRIDGLPDWATRPDIQAAFPTLAQIVNGVGNAEWHWTMNLTADGWKPAI
jgi:hypothetical protein